METFYSETLKRRVTVPVNDDGFQRDAYLIAEHVLFDSVYFKAHHVLSLVRELASDYCVSESIAIKAYNGYLKEIYNRT